MLCPWCSLPIDSLSIACIASQTILEKGGCMGGLAFFITSTMVAMNA